MRPLRLLLVEDSQDDALLLERALFQAGWAVTTERVETAVQMRQALERGPWDVVISDHGMPSFNAPAALALLRERGDVDRTPFIIVSGTMPDEAAVEALRAGAADFLTKQKLSQLGPAIDRELRNVELRRERREMLEALRQAVRARDDFLSIASHELKTPLTSLQLQIQSLLKAAQPPGGAPAERLWAKLAAVDRSTGRLAELVNRLLDISRLSAGNFELAREEFDLAELVAEVLSRLHHHAEASGSKIESELAPAVGRWDRMRIESAVGNLIDNALKYGQGRPIHVSVEDGGAVARLRVRDEGIGIAPEDQERIFERFGRAAPSEADGMGIGLWLARRIAETHGGSITVQSTAGGGSTFTLELPKREPEAPPGDGTGARGP